jgi:hypothetical protein
MPLTRRDDLDYKRLTKGDTSSQLALAPNMREANDCASEQRSDAVSNGREPLRMDDRRLGWPPNNDHGGSFVCLYKLDCDGVRAGGLT